MYFLRQILFTARSQSQIKLQLEKQLFRLDIKVWPAGPRRNNIMHSYNTDSLLISKSKGFYIQVEKIDTNIPKPTAGSIAFIAMSHF